MQAVSTLPVLDLFQIIASSDIEKEAIMTEIKAQAAARIFTCVPIMADWGSRLAVFSAACGLYTDIKRSS